MVAVLEAPRTASQTTARLAACAPAVPHTTLFDLMAALQDAAGPNDAAVVAAVVDLLHSQRLRFLAQTA